MHKWVFLFLWLVGSVVYSEAPVKYAKEFMEYCGDYNVPTWIMSRLIEYESGWNPYTVNENKNGSVDEGICQLNSAYIKDFERMYNMGLPINTFDWRQNLRIGIKHLRYLYDLTGSWWSAVASYNMGYYGWFRWCRGERSLPTATKKELDFIFR